MDGNVEDRGNGEMVVGWGILRDDGAIWSSMWSGHTQ